MGERELVEHPGRSVVQLDVCLVAFGGAVVSQERVADVAHQLERPRREGIQFGGLAQVAHGGVRRRIEFADLPGIPRCGIQLVPSPVGLPAFEVAEHRIVLERDRAAERLDRRKRVVARQGALATVDELTVFSLPAQRRQFVGGGHAHDDEEHGQENALHRRSC